MSGEIFRREKVEMNPTFIAAKYFASISKSKQIKVRMLNNMFLADSLEWKSTLKKA